MAPKMEKKRVGDLAATGSAKDVENLLRAYGTESGYLDWIEYGVSQSGAQTKADKKALIAAFVAKQGVFATGQEIPPNTAQEIQESQAEILQQLQENKETITFLAETILELTKRIDDLQEDKAQKKVAPTAEPSGKGKTPKAPVFNPGTQH